MDPRPIFIHALFRTGSTYLWTKFRMRDGFCCYYEPFNETVGGLDENYFMEYKNRKFLADKNRHPEIEKPYFYEYRKLIRNGKKGVPLFKKSFSYDEFFFNGQNHDLQQYIDSLIDGAGERKALFQFNRSSMRVSWFKNNYPSSINLYLFRNPRDQWESYNDCFRRNNNLFFLTMDVLIAGKHMRLDQVKPLTSVVPLYEYTSDDIKDEEVYYRLLCESYTPEERYAVFYYLWLLCLIENCMHADYVVSIDAISADDGVRNDLAGFFKSHDISEVNFDDVNIKKYDSYTLGRGTMDNIESTISGLIASFFAPEVIMRIRESMQHNEQVRSALRGLDADTASSGKQPHAWRGGGIPGERYRDLSYSIAEKALIAIKAKQNWIDSMYSGYTYRVGNLLLAPVKKARELFSGLRKR